MVSVVGRPNVGKSSLVNALVGQKVSIVTRKPQTTRHRIQGVVHRQQGQIVLVDTPGLHGKTTRALNRYLNDTAAAGLRDVDLILFVIEAGTSPLALKGFPKPYGQLASYDEIFLPLHGAHQAQNAAVALAAPHLGLAMVRGQSKRCHPWPGQHDRIVEAGRHLHLRGPVVVPPLGVHAEPKPWRVVDDAAPSQAASGIDPDIDLSRGSFSPQAAISRRTGWVSEARARAMSKLALK